MRFARRVQRRPAPTGDRSHPVGACLSGQGCSSEASTALPVSPSGVTQLPSPFRNATRITRHRSAFPPHPGISQLPIGASAAPLACFPSGAAASPLASPCSWHFRSPSRLLSSAWVAPPASPGFLEHFRRFLGVARFPPGSLGCASSVPAPPEHLRHFLGLARFPPRSLGRTSSGPAPLSTSAAPSASPASFRARRPRLWHRSASFRELPPRLPGSPSHTLSGTVTSLMTEPLFLSTRFGSSDGDSALAQPWGAQLDLMGDGMLLSGRRAVVHRVGCPEGLSTESDSVQVASGRAGQCWVRARRGSGQTEDREQ